MTKNSGCPAPCYSFQCSASSETIHSPDVAMQDDEKGGCDRQEVNCPKFKAYNHGDWSSIGGANKYGEGVAIHTFPFMQNHVSLFDQQHWAVVSRDHICVQSHVPKVHVNI